MQKQMPYSFSYLSPSYTKTTPKPDSLWGYDYEYGPMQRHIHCVMVTIESSRSKKQCVRARGSWDDDLCTVVPELPPLSEEAINSRDSMAHCHYFWDWMQYGAVLAICDIFLENRIDGVDADFVDGLPKPEFSLVRKDPKYFEKLEEFAKSIEFRFEDNGF